MVKAFPAPKPHWPQYVGVAYMYALALGGGAVAALMGLGGFDFAFIAYATPGLPVMTVVLSGLAIFSLPFLARLRLSMLARFLSALFAVVTPVVLICYILYLMTEHVIPFNLPILSGGLLLVLLAFMSFAVLGGPKALSFSKK